MTLQNGTSVSYGDTIKAVGVMKYPENFMTDTDREFDYVNYLKVHDIYGLMKVSTSEIISQHNKSLFIEKLFLIKKYFVDTVKNLFPKSEAGLFAGISIGEKSLLPKDILADFQIAGLTHMIVLSGYNITIIAMSTITLLAYSGLGYRARRVGAMLIIPVFLVMTGLGASSVRAGCMSMILFLLQITTRPAHHLRIIFYTAVIMIFANPRILLRDPSFHMSFLAFIGLVYVTPIMSKFFNGDEESFFLKKLFIETFSVQVFVMPYIIWMNGRVSLLLLVSNILTVPLVPIIMGTGFVVTLLAMVTYPLGAMLAVPVKLGLTYIIWVAHGVASVKAVTFVVPPFGLWVMILIYGAMVGYVVWWNRNCKKCYT
jgi:competence protein ComEC